MRASFFFLCAFLLLPPCSSRSATYYVDADNGSDSNRGTQGEPWKHCPGMTEWSGSIALNAGDMVYFNNAGIWEETSGSAILIVNGGVTYDGCFWGPGERALFRSLVNMGSSTTVATGDSLIRFSDDHASSETIVRGFELDLNYKAVNGIIINRYYAKDLIGAVKRVENCVIHDIDSDSMRYGLLIGNGNSYDTEHVEVIGNTVYNTPRSAILGYEEYRGGTGHVDYVVYRGNEAYDAGRAANGTAGAGICIKNDCNHIIIEYNYLHDNLLGIAVSNDNGYPGPNDVTIKHNISSHNAKNGIYIANNSTKEVSIFSNVIYGNLHNGSTGTGIHFESDLGGTVQARIYNNTLYQNANGEISIANSSADFSVLEIKNNILMPSAGKSAIYGSTGKITSQSNNLTANPNFKNTSNLPAGFVGTYGVDLRPDNDGLSVESGPAIDGGVDLGADYNMAINSVVRPDGAWDIGAYEYAEPVGADGSDVSQDGTAPDSGTADGAAEDAGGGQDGDGGDLNDSATDPEEDTPEVNGGCGCGVLYRTERHGTLSRPGSSQGGGGAANPLGVVSGFLWLAFRRSGRRGKGGAR